MKWAIFVVYFKSMPARILVFDNYDSFTYNLVHMVEHILHARVDVVLNDQCRLENIAGYDKIILSPGPGIPSEAGMLLPLIREYAGKIPMLGVCLGHQAIAEAFGGSLLNLEDVYHGVATKITVADPDWYLYQGLGPVFSAGRYHSWVVSPEGLPACLRVTAVDDQGMIMSMQHREFDISGVQFHPESVLTPLGEQILRNWLAVPVQNC